MANSHDINEPVAWMWINERGSERLEWEPVQDISKWKSTPLYAAPVRTKDLTDAVDAAMVEMQNIHPPLRRSECERLIRAANYAAPVRTKDQK
jgi:hypothetical protein